VFGALFIALQIYPFNELASKTDENYQLPASSNPTRQIIISLI
jgi:hypothetical protein